VSFIGDKYILTADGQRFIAKDLVDDAYIVELAERIHHSILVFNFLPVCQGWLKPFYSFNWISVDLVKKVGIK